VNSRLWAQRRKRERGAASVEFALVALIFFTIVVGLMDLTMALFSMNSVSTASRDGARAAAAWKGTDPSAASSCSQTSSASFEDEGNEVEARRILCFTGSRVYLIGADRVRVRIQFEDGDGLEVEQGELLPDPQSTFVVVCTQVRYKSISGLLSPLLNNRIQASSARMRLEASPPELDASGVVVNPRTFDIPAGGQQLFDPSRPC
jgi:Flp pilus assembly pilin Flp